MCLHCGGDGGCAYCDGFLQDSELNAFIETPKRSVQEIKKLEYSPDCESL